MGVGVQKPIDHHHAKVERRQVLHHLVELDSALRELVVQLIDLGSRAALHDQDPAARVFVQKLGGSNGRIVPEKPLETLDVFRLLVEVHLLPYAVGEFTHDVGERLSVMVREEDIEPEQKGEADVQIERHNFLHTGAEYLDHNLPSIDDGLMHLAEARGGGGLPLELIEDLIHRPTQLTLDDRDDLIRGIRRGLILKRADRRQVGLGKDIRSCGHDLAELDERRPQLGHPSHQLFCPPPMMPFGAARGGAHDDPSPPIPQKGHDQGCEAHDDPNPSEEAPHGSSFTE